jgi:hypothetical protein
MPKGDLLVARRVCRSDMEGALCAIFNGSSSSRKTAPMFVRRIERMPLGAAAHGISPRPQALGIGQFNSDTAGLFRPPRVNKLAKNIALKKGLKRAYASCLQGAIRSAAAAASLTGRCRRLPMPQLGPSRVITLGRFPFVTNGTREGRKARLCRRTFSILPWVAHWLTRAPPRRRHGAL